MRTHIRILFQHQEYPRIPKIPDLLEYPSDYGGYPTESETMWPALEVYPGYFEILMYLKKLITGIYLSRDI